ncbi:WD40 repeat-containing protein [Pleurocapsa sp. PCC 7327]|uniref:WD40 domain-containing protein n=1 Tax=Pleurocapsa sp. PCC 7327 TaxID=118163 RepID=UPI00029FB0C0|nr:AAA-like domain-containing protein [Pleurocapsa sp. PCC 7327]AFY77683.1 WD40 repeat-containing protein [Pleurocapsa sp. PCC 7327]
MHDFSAVPSALSSGCLYKVGGSLAFDHPTYVERRADKELLDALRLGKFCYVFNCRQMGKSSLRVRAMHRLQAQGMSCASIDLTSLGSHVSQQQWYSGIITQLCLGFNLTEKINLKAWLREREELPPIQKLGQFIEAVILVNCPGKKIFIFIDEIDKVISLDFPLDDFFSLIRFCYNQRAENPQYNRLAFALFGVATPSDLIREKTQTSFNIGVAIELTGFTIEEVRPLERGLKNIAENPGAVLKEILYWTGGQPFLTQKLCQIVATADTFIPLGDEAEIVEKIARDRIIENWESQDEPIHLKTIRDRLLVNEQRAGALLGFYQQILQQGFIEADGSPEQSELRLSGLVVKRDGKLQAYNPIYQAVFNRPWVDKQLEKLRPYAEALVAWQVSQYQDESRLLRGQALKDALAWAVGKNLSNVDYQFLTASQKLDKREAERKLEAERKANKILTDANERATRMIRIGSAILIVSVLGSAIALSTAIYAFNKQQQARLGTQLQKMGDTAWRQFEFEQLEALLTAMKAGQELENLIQKDNRPLQDYPATSPILALQQILDTIQEKNQLEGHQETVNSISFSPDGKWIATASRDATARLWDRQGNGRVIFQGHQSDVYSVAWSPDGQTLATASKDGTVKLWNLRGQELATFKGHESSVYSVAWSPDGTRIATASRDETARIWDWQGRQLAILVGHQRSVDDISFSPDGKQIATASRDGTVRLWNLEGKQLAIFQDVTNAFYSVAWSPDGKHIAAAARDGTAKIWDRQGNPILTLIGHQELVNSVAFSPNGEKIATASSDGTAKLWDWQGNVLATLAGHQEPIYDVAFSADGQQVATASSDTLVKLWHLKERPPGEFKIIEDTVTSVGFSPDERLIAIASKDGMVYLQDLQGNLKHQFKAHRDRIYSINFSPDGRQIATASSSGIVKIWNLQGEALVELKVNSVPVYGVNFSPNGQLLAIAFRDGDVWLWDVGGDRPKKVTSFKAHREAVYSVSFSPVRLTLSPEVGQQIVTTSRDGTAKLWDLQGNLLTEFKGHQDLIYRATFNPDGRTIATASRDGTTKLWNLQGNLIADLKGDPFPVYSVSFSPDGKRVATASSDGTARVWDLQGNLRAEFKGDRDLLYGINFQAERSPFSKKDSQQVVTVSRNGTVRLWQVEEELARLEGLLEQGCKWLDDYLVSHSQEREKLKVCSQSAFSK